jgi:hypothetical protein
MLLGETVEIVVEVGISTVRIESNNIGIFTSIFFEG